MLRKPGPIPQHHSERGKVSGAVVVPSVQVLNGQRVGTVEGQLFTSGLFSLLCVLGAADGHKEF
jgi:hypothetical protein